MNFHGLRKNRALDNDDTKEEEDCEVGDGNSGDDEGDTITTESYFDEWMEALDNLDSTHDIEDEEGSEIL